MGECPLPMESEFDLVFNNSLLLLALTGRSKSLSHQMAWLVCAGDAPNTSIGSHKTKHSHIDQRWDKDASKRRRGGGEKGAVAARI